LEEAEAILSEELPDMKYIQIANDLKGEDFYRTDLHWDQSKILDVVSYLGNAMDFHAPDPTDLDAAVQGTFLGVFAGQVSLPMAPDVMTYMNPKAGSATYSASYLNIQGQVVEGPIYDPQQFASVDPYNFFLRGPQPLIWLKKDGVDIPRRSLYYFRDSFGSSLGPLIAFGDSYDQVVLIDLRYIDSRVLPQFVEFEEGADVLFLYSSQIFNQSGIIKVQ